MIHPKVNKRSPWLLSLGVFLFAILNSGHNENFITALQGAVQTEWLADDNDVSASWLITAPASIPVVLSVGNCFASIQGHDRLMAVAYKVANLKFLGFYSSLHFQVECRYLSNSDSKDHNSISSVG